MQESLGKKVKDVLNAMEESIKKNTKDENQIKRIHRIKEFINKNKLNKNRLN